MEELYRTRVLALSASVVMAALAAGCGGPREPLRLTSAGGVRPGGEEPARPDDALTEEDLVPRAWLYRVSGGDSAAPSYLLGTMHIGITFRAAVPTPLDSALFDARSVVMEIDMREATRFFSEAPRIPVPRRQWIDRTLPRETFGRLTAELSRVAPAEAIARVPPGPLTLYLQQVRMAEVEAAEDGRAPIPGAVSSTRLDRSIFDWAIASGIPFVALETTEEAMTALATIDAGNAMESLRQIVDDPEAARGEARRLRDAYVSLDEERVLAVTSEMSAEERHALLEVRNTAWMPHLVPEIQAGRAFVAVGLAHLLGEGSIVERLRALGYEVERVLGDGGLRPSERTGVIIGSGLRERGSRLAAR